MDLQCGDDHHWLLVFCNSVSGNIVADGSPAYLVPSAIGIKFVGAPGNSGTPSSMLMNILQGNLVAGFANGAQFVDDTEGSTAAGIFDTLFVDNFFASDGSIGSNEIGGNDADDGRPYYGSSQWQSFWDLT